MKNKYLVLSLLFCTSLIPEVFSQNETAIIIGDRIVTLGEFERLYNKNSSAFSMEEQNIDEYLERFVNFKLKVIEAENIGNDTTASFLNEFNTYKKELAKPYMMDSAFMEELMLSAYSKLKKEINASHILININESAPPSDTLAAWNKIMSIRNRALKGDDFGKLAEQNSDDPSAVNNKGNLGWFTAFRMVPEFEDMAFITPIGDISMPVRTRFGYHIIKVHDSRAARGSVLAAHIYIRVPEDATEENVKIAKEKIYSIHNSLKAGEDFAELARLHSDDKGSANNGGRLQWFSAGVMIPEFDNVAFSLKNPGQFSEPVKSFYGWHILQLLDKKTIGTYEEEKAELLSRINSDKYNNVKKRVYIEKLKKEHNYTLNQQNLETFLTYIDSSIFEGNWSASLIPDPAKVLFSLDDEIFKMGDFGRFLEEGEKPKAGSNLRFYVNERFQSFSDDIVYNYEESLLADKYPDFKYILQEYHDGILLFDLTDKMVWSKAVNDSLGLENFFNKNQEKYKWETRAEAYIVKVNDPSLVPAARKLTSKNAGKSNFSSEFLAKELCPDDSAGTCIDLKHGMFEKGTNDMVDAVEWKKGLGENIEDNGSVTFVYIRKIIRPGFKTLDECRGLAISDYQEYLEKQWIKELREKYPVTINRDVISKIN